MSEDFSPQQEPDRLPRKAIWRVFAVGLGVTIGAIAFSGGFLRARSRPPSREGVPSTTPEQIGFVEQRLILSNHRGLDQRSARREALEHYGWVDRDHGVARIPIERAIDLEIAIPLDRPIGHEDPVARVSPPPRGAADGGL